MRCDPQPLRDVEATVSGQAGALPRRSPEHGWLDLISLKYSVRVNSLTELFITKLDVLSGLEEIKLGVGYMNGDKVITDYPYQQMSFIMLNQFMRHTRAGLKILLL